MSYSAFVKRNEKFLSLWLLHYYSGKGHDPRLSKDVFALPLCLEPHLKEGSDSGNPQSTSASVWPESGQSSVSWLHCQRDKTSEGSGLHWLTSFVRCTYEITNTRAVLLLIETCVHAQSLKLCPTLCAPMDCSPLGSSVHGIVQTRIQVWIAMLFSRGSSPPGDCTRISYVCCIGRRVPYH